ncbi:hypothetical protein BKA67DRAFT_681618 [Truncatella angustata]|uniref:RING-type domain-containing protein n=1 Tax=Truncatella angustata TaxID=152316 RepID=A0A9P8UEL8_9PEZI|nr:uncharacterized protein BKA67DRAFT_681618 [Truncatella angustata]KAH6648542.1 hypothetical protein BKA67DRAFT_681618 [Truncatella angustata]
MSEEFVAANNLEENYIENLVAYFDANGDLSPDVTCNVACIICSSKLAIVQPPDGDHRPWSLLYCGHTFCYECIEHWVSSSGDPTCPQCRKPLRHGGCQHKYHPKKIVLKEGFNIRKVAEMYSSGETPSRCENCVLGRPTTPSPGPSRVRPNVLDFVDPGQEVGDTIRSQYNRFRSNLNFSDQEALVPDITAQEELQRQWGMQWAEYYYRQGFQEALRRRPEGGHSDGCSATQDTSSSKSNAKKEKKHDKSSGHRASSSKSVPTTPSRSNGHRASSSKSVLTTPSRSNGYRSSSSNFSPTSPSKGKSKSSQPSLSHTHGTSSRELEGSARTTSHKSSHHHHH